jgi:hypothetical protein
MMEWSREPRSLAEQIAANRRGRRRHLHDGFGNPSHTRQDLRHRRARTRTGYGQAAGALAALIEAKQVHCLQVGEGTVCDGKSKPTSRDRIVGQCFIDKLDIAGEMAKSGTVCDWPKFSGGHYKVSDKTCVRK